MIVEVISSYLRMLNVSLLRQRIPSRSISIKVTSTFARRLIGNGRECMLLPLIPEETGG